MRSRKNGGIIGSRNDIQSQSISGVYTNDDVVITNTNSDIARMRQEQSKTARWIGAGVDPYYDTVVCQFGDALYTDHILQDKSGNHWEDWQASAYQYTVSSSEFGPGYTDYCSSFGEDGFYQIQDTTDMKFGTQAFTIEFWVKPMRQNNGTSKVYLISRGQQANTNPGAGWTVFMDSHYRIGFYDATSDYITTCGYPINLDVWAHVAIVRSNNGPNGLTIYINGMSEAVGGAQGNFTDLNSWWFIGRDCVGNSASSGQNATQFAGRMTDIRITKSVVYLGNFTPPTSPLDMTITNTVYSFSCTTPHHDNIPANQPQGKWVLRSGYQSSYGTQLVRRLDSPYNPLGSIKQYGVGKNSAYCTYSSRFYTIYDTNPNKSLKFGTGNFTVEAYVYFKVSYGMSKSIIGKGSGDIFNNTGGGWSLFVDGNGSLIWIDGNTTYTSNTSIQTYVQPGGWYHIAAVRSGTGANQFNMYINGVNVYSGSCGANYNDSNPLIVFADRNINYTYNGFASCIRLSTTARYTGNTTNGVKVFTPSVAKTTIVDANTLYLTAASSGVPSQTYGNWTDRGTARLTVETVNNNGFQEFMHTPISRFGFSWQFREDGNVRMKATSGNGGFDFGTGDFSVEFWIATSYIQRDYTYSSTKTLIDTRNSFTDNGFCIRYNGAYKSIDVLANGYYLNGSNGGYPIMTSSNIEIGYRKWVHVCLQRTSGKLALYINGRLNQETTYTQSLSSGSGFMTIGNQSYPNLDYTSHSWYGWMCDIRVLKGSSAYGVSGNNPEYIQLPKSNLTKLANTVLLCANSPNIVDNSGVNFVSWPYGDSNDTSAYVPISNYTPYSSVEFANTGYLAATARTDSGGFIEQQDINDDGNQQDLSFIQRMASPWTIECFACPSVVDAKNSATNRQYVLYNAYNPGHDGFKISMGESGAWDTGSSSIPATYNTVQFELWNYDWNNNWTQQYLTSGNTTIIQSACWNHIAVVYDPTLPSANQMAIFVNGTRYATGPAFNPGYRQRSTYGLKQGASSGCRISNIARYNNLNTTITIPSTTWTYDANTISLINYEGPFTDRAGKLSSQWFRAGISTTYKKFGNGSIKFMNKNYNGSQITNLSSSQFDFIYLTGNMGYSTNILEFRISDFTIEGWACWHDDTAGGKSFSQGWNGNHPGSILWHLRDTMRVGIDNNGKWQLTQSGGGVNDTISQTITSNVVVSTVTSGAKFDHVVMMRRKGNIIFYVNGQEIGQLSQNYMGQYGSPAYPVGNFNVDYYLTNGNERLCIGYDDGRNSDQGWCGYLQDFRVSAMARYDTRVINGVSQMVFVGTNKPALPVISKAPHPTKGF